eukprot:scaffold74616_cov75-Phaeocystis_antarctica.AAC.4
MSGVEVQAGPGGGGGDATGKGDGGGGDGDGGDGDGEATPGAAHWVGVGRVHIRGADECRGAALRWCLTIAPLGRPGGEPRPRRPDRDGQAEHEKPGRIRCHGRRGAHFCFTASAGNIYGNIYHSTRGVCCIRGCSKSQKSVKEKEVTSAAHRTYFYRAVLSSY